MQHLGNADWVRVFRTWCLEPLIPVGNGGDTDVKGMWLSRDGSWLVPGFAGGLVVTFAAREAEESYQVSRLETGSCQQSLTLTHSLPAGSELACLFFIT